MKPPANTLAIGRVDRLGQDKDTTVYCYATMPDTVESRILALGVRNHTSIYLAEEGREVEDMPNVASAAHKMGDLGVQGDEHELLQLVR
jgi:E3 ubiquitin-protein ligase SHPRH